MWRASCPKCGSLRVKAPKPPSARTLLKYIFVAIFRRKDLLHGLDEGRHNTFKHEGQPDEPTSGLEEV
jgi:hypothetical protein